MVEKRGGFRDVVDSFGLGRLLSGRRLREQRGRSYWSSYVDFLNSVGSALDDIETAVSVIGDELYDWVDELRFLAARDGERGGLGELDVLVRALKDLDVTVSDKVRKLRGIVRRSGRSVRMGS